MEEIAMCKVVKTKVDRTHMYMVSNQRSWGVLQDGNTQEGGGAPQGAPGGPKYQSYPNPCVYGIKRKVLESTTRWKHSQVRGRPPWGTRGPLIPKVSEHIDVWYQMKGLGEDYKMETHPTMGAPPMGPQGAPNTKVVRTH